MRPTVRLWEYSAPHWGHAFRRIESALRQFAPPWVQWTDEKSADLRIVHIVGPAEIPIVLRDIKRTVIIQECYHTAQAHLHDYPALWKQARLCVSFHNLVDYTDTSFNFLRIPWGADENVFQHRYYDKRSIGVMTTGHIARDEAIDHVYAAAKKAGIRMVHTGENFQWPLPYEYRPYMSVPDLVELLNQCSYVTGLRLVEGFEILCVEGLFCGARAVVPRLPSYELYGEHAEYIDPEGNITDQLFDLFSKPTRPIHAAEREALIEKFSWRSIMRQFYHAIDKCAGGRR